MTGPRCPLRLSTPLLVGCALWAGLAAETGAQGNAASDRAVLEAFYDATGGPDWIDNTNWKRAVPLSAWFGVWTDTAGRVTRLQLPGNGLAGPIPAELGRLISLRTLDFDGNALTGPIPAELGNLAGLEWLYLPFNPLTGSLPQSLTRLSQLRTLNISNTGRVRPPMSSSRRGWRRSPTSAETRATARPSPSVPSRPRRWPSRVRRWVWPWTPTSLTPTTIR